MKFLSDFKPDISSGFSVALVALPLSIGIALASGAPASSGIMAAVIGGLIGSWLGGCQVTINGPAAGLIVIVLDAITSMSHGNPVQGMKGMLAAAVVAGAIQTIFGLLKLGRKGTAFPTSVIHGMMAAIGLIIIAKQVHNLFKAAWMKKIPAPLLTITLGAGLAAMMGLTGKELLTIPTDFSQWIILPDFSVMTTFVGWKSAITLALVGSLETVLSASAVDKLDPQHRKSDLDRDLTSKGICNMLSASVGGLPMIAEIVRSSANVSFGAKTWRSNFFHGVVILALVLLAPKALALIPLASLAAILVMVGSRLGSPAHFMHALKIGPDNLIGFVVTLVVTLSVDLLVGIFAGAFVQFAVEMYMGLKIKNLIHPFFAVSFKDKDEEIKIESALTFSNFIEVRDEIMKGFTQNKNVILDLKESDYIDHNVMEEIEDLKNTFKSKNLTLTIWLSEEHHSLGKESSSALKRTA